MTIQGVVLDRFGVLQEDGLPLAYRFFGGNPTAEASFIARAIAAAHAGDGPTVAEAFAQRFRITTHKWAEVCRQKSRVRPGIIGLAHKLRRAGKKVGLLTNSSADSHPPPEIADVCHKMVISGEVGLAKPDVRIYELAAGELGVDPAECVMVDDNPAFVAGARLANMEAVQYVGIASLRRSLFTLGL